MTPEDIDNSFYGMFRLIDPNNKYAPAKIATKYYLIGGALLRFPIKFSVISADMRFSIGICIESGLGKKAIFDVVEEVANLFRMRFDNATSLHEEQLVGKRYYNKETSEWVNDLGYLWNHFFVKDDALPFLNHPSFEKSRNYLLQDLDVYGSNYITKKLTGITRRLRYRGRASFLYFLQPSERIKEENIASGLYRRAPILRIKLTQDEKNEILRKRIKEKFNPQPKPFFDFYRFLRTIESIEVKELSPEVSDLINKASEGYNKGYKGLYLLDNYDFITQNNIIKLGVIRVITSLYSYIYSKQSYNPYIPYNPDKFIYYNKEYKSKVKFYNPYNPQDEENVEIEGFKGNFIPPSNDSFKNKDIKETPYKPLALTIELSKEDIEAVLKEYKLFSDALVLFARENSESGTHHISSEIIATLIANESYSEESDFSVRELLQSVSIKLNVPLNTVRYHYLKLVKDKQICSKQKGQHGSVVWIPNEE